MYAMKYYSVIKKKKTDKIRSFEEMWMDREIVILSEES